jgi:hypothetical protein
MSSYYVPGNTNQLPILQPFLEKYGLAWLAEEIAPGLDLLLTAQTFSSIPQSVTAGEVAYTLDSIVQKWAVLLPTTSSTTKTSQFWNTWATEWMSTAQRAIATDSSAPPAPMNILRAANYYFLASQTFPISELGQQALAYSYEMLFWFLDTAKMNYVNVSIPYITDNGQSVNLPGIAVAPTGVKNPPLILSTSGGLDWPLPGAVIISLFSYLEAGFAVLIYEGPGQVRTTLLIYFHEECSSMHVN